MKYYIDGEWDGHNGPLLSFAIVREDGISHYYIVSDIAEDPWVQENVIPILRFHKADRFAMISEAQLGDYLREFLDGDQDPVVISDSTTDTTRFTKAYSTTTDGDYQHLDHPRMRYVIENVEVYPSTLEGAVRHNAWWDAMALRHKLTGSNVANAKSENPPDSEMETIPCMLVYYYFERYPFADARKMFEIVRPRLGDEAAGINALMEIMETLEVSRVQCEKVLKNQTDAIGRLVSESYDMENHHLLRAVHLVMNRLFPDLQPVDIDGGINYPTEHMRPESDEWWHDISSAPKDGKICLVYALFERRADMPQQFITAGWYRDGRWWMLDSCSYSLGFRALQPTKWNPKLSLAIQSGLIEYLNGVQIEKSDDACYYQKKSEE